MGCIIIEQDMCETTYLYLLKDLHNFFLIVFEGEKDNQLIR